MRPLFHSRFEIDKVEVPTSLGQAQENLDRLGQTSRRSFFARSVGTAAGAAAAAAAGASAAQGAFTRGGLPSLYAGSTTKYFQELQFDEISHVNINSAAIRSLGGTVRPYPTFQGITNLNGQQLLEISTLLANTGVGAISFAARYVANPSVLAVGTSILLVEGYHAGWLNSQSNIALVPNGLVYDVPLTIPQVVAAVSPYIASFNDPNNLFPPTFSTTTKSTANDIAILNFAIIIDLLEATLYYNNVPRIFGRG